MAKKNKTAKILWAIFIAVLGSTLFAGRWVHPHVTFGVEGLPYFNAWFGFFSCAAIVAVSKLLGIFLKRDVKYYK